MSKEERPTMAETGNISALREALEWIQGFGYVVDGEFRFPDTNMVKQQVDAALAAPPRNCDVGTADEQYKRFKKFCFDNMGDGMNEPRCFQCPLGQSKGSCRFDWAQMPYAPAEGETK